MNERLIKKYRLKKLERLMKEEGMLTTYMKRKIRKKLGQVK